LTNKNDKDEKASPVCILT